MENNLNKLFKLYAYLISTETDLGFRIPVHNMICKYLDVRKEEFRPFESELILGTPTFEECMVLIQKTVNKIKKKYGYQY